MSGCAIRAARHFLCKVTKLNFTVFVQCMKVVPVKFSEGLYSFKNSDWKSSLTRDIKLFEPYTLGAGMSESMNVTLKRYQNIYDKWKIEIRKAGGKVLGREILKMNPALDEIKGETIEVRPEYRQKGYRYGELLRLFSIIEMNENKYSKLNLYSLPEAVYFHSKYFFEPDNYYLPERDMMLKTISLDSDFPELVSLAEELINRPHYSPEDEVHQNELSVQTNKLTKQYITRALEEDRELAYLKHPFKYGFTMSLTREKLLNNKEYFNNLFEQHGIDYRI